MRTRMLILTFAAAWLLLPCMADASPAWGLSVFPQEDTSQALTGPGAQEPEVEPVHPGPKDITERIAIYVFLGWLWLSILVLIYALRLKIRESDRLHDFAYFDTDKKTRSKGPDGSQAP
jgi:hypothetical protein